MGGGHGPHTTPNMNNMQETDEEMQGKIQLIETIKYNPNMFHIDICDPVALCNVMGGVPTLVTTAGGAALSYGYYAAQVRTYNMHSNIRRTQGRLLIGSLMGLAFGYVKFGDRQRVHNAYVAERLRARYPESVNLHEQDLWRFKGVKAPHSYYKWA